MNSILVNQEKSKRTSVKFSFQSMLMLMAAIMMALVTLTACAGSDENDNDPDEIENGENGGGGVAGKRIHTMVDNSGPTVLRSEYIYNSDGTINRTNIYDESSRLVMYSTSTSNPDGTMSETKYYNTEDYSNFNLAYTETYTYDPNKKPKKVETVVLQGSCFQTTDFTFQNGRKTGEVITSTCGTDIVTIQYDITYDSQGRRTTTTETHSMYGTRKITRTYNSDGTLQKVTFPEFNSTKTITYTCTWEDGKTTYNFDDFMPW